MAEVALYEFFYEVDKRGEHDGHGKLIGISDQAYCEYPLVRPVFADLEGDKEDDETIYELGYQRGACCPQPYVLLAGYFFDLVEYPHIDDLADKEGGETTDYDPHTLAKDVSKCRLHIRNPGVFLAAYPEGSICRYPYSEVKHKKGVADKTYGNVGYSFNCLRAEVFIHDICHYKLERPQQHTTGEGEGKTMLAQQGKRMRGEAKHALE